MDAKTLGNHILLSRRDLALTQEELAAKVGVSRAYITNIEQGRAKNVGIDVIFALARELGVSVAYLLGLTEDPLAGDDGVVMRDRPEEYVVIESRNPAERQLLQQAIDEFTALTAGQQRFAINMLRMMRQAEERENVPLSPRIVE